MLSMAEKEVDMGEIEQTSSPVSRFLEKSPRVVGRINYVNPLIALRKRLP